VKRNASVVFYLECIIATNSATKKNITNILKWQESQVKDSTPVKLFINKSQLAMLWDYTPLHFA